MKALITAAALIALFGLTACTGQSETANPAPASPSATAASGPAEAPAADSASAPAAPAAPAAPPAETPAADSAPAAPPAANPSPLTEGKVHFTGDYTKLTPADSAKITELGKQWRTADKQALFQEKMDGSGLSRNVPPEQAETFYGQAAEACQRRFDGYKPPLEGVWLEIENLALSVYCPGLE
ncbi:hypothetical protein [Pseudarthrobacter sp. PvP090]|uniref:hypothetical protein n=1 Tax=Pseudarthrobacter sp. PvP090 TaxID=3156393 RepID=UPI003395ECCC